MRGSVRKLPPLIADRWSVKRNASGHHLPGVAHRSAVSPFTMHLGDDEVPFQPAVVAGRRPCRPAPDLADAFRVPDSGPRTKPPSGSLRPRTPGPARARARQSPALAGEVSFTMSMCSRAVVSKAAGKRRAGPVLVHVGVPGTVVLRCEPVPSDQCFGQPFLLVQRKVNRSRFHRFCRAGGGAGDGLEVAADETT